MNTNNLQLRKMAIACALLACLPLYAQMPWTLIAVFVGLLGINMMLDKPPHKAVLLMLVVFSLALLVLEYKGRIGRDVAASMLALMLSLKCLETKNIRDFRSALGFSLFIPFAALLSDQSLPTMLLALASIAGWLILLQRSYLGHWTAFSQSRLASLMQISKQLLLALPLTLVLFWLFPRIASPLWGLPELANQSTGLGDSMKPDQWLDSLADDRIAFRVQYKQKSPSPSQRYWRGPVLWDFNGIEWTRTESDNQSRLVIPDLIDNADKTISYQLSLEPTEKKYLPTLDWPQSAPLDGFLSQEKTAYVTRPIQKLTQYDAISSPLWIQATALDANLKQRALSFPAELNPRTQALAKQWRREAGSDRAYIQRVLAWITKDFSYTLAVDEPGRNAIDDFLFTDKKGFCQQFSSSFAILMRAAGIPSRVVTGYAGGYKNPYGSYWVLYNRDAHAWTEVWLQGEGWIRIDPTAAVAPENILDTLSGTNGSESYFGEQSIFSPIFDYSDFIKSRWNTAVLGFNAVRQEGLLKGIGIEKLQNWQLLVGTVLAGGLLSFLVFALLNRAQKLQLHPVQQQWRKLLLRLQKQGHPKLSYETALDFVRRIDSTQLAEIAERYTQWRYGKSEFSEEQIQQLVADMNSLSINDV